MVGAEAFKLWWASNPGAMTHLCTCWMEHSSLSVATQIVLLGIASGIFKDLELIPTCVKQMFAAEVMRLETDSLEKNVQLAVSCLLCKFPDIPEL